MWIVATITFMSIVGPKTFGRDDPLLRDLQPTITEEQCHQNAYDVAIKSMRDRGISMTFNVTCKKEEFV